MMTPDLVASLVAVGRIALVLLALGGYALLAARWQRASRRDVARLFEQADLAAGDLRSMSEGLASLELRIAALVERSEAQWRSPAASSANARSYELGVRLARGGASREELVTSCGLRAPEADLLVRLHGQAHAPRGASQVLAGVADIASDKRSTS